MGIISIHDYDYTIYANKLWTLASLDVGCIFFTLDFIHKGDLVANVQVTDK